ncbi:MAG: TonB-dependent receptor [Candidatus Eisenbacteria bacterium]
MKRPSPFTIFAALVVTATCLQVTSGWYCVCLASETRTFPDTVFTLPEILIEAERISELEGLRDRPAFLTIIPMDDTGHRVSSAAEYLARSVGVHVRSTGGYGAYSTASVRGSSAKQVRVFLDGIPLGQAQSGVIDLADIPVSSLSRIEVYRGFGPYDLSGSSIGGVVNLVTKRADDMGSGQVSTSYGSLSTTRYHGSYFFARSDWDMLAIASATSSANNFEFLDDNGTPYNPDDDETVERINNDVDEYEALLKVSRPFSGGTLVASNQFYCRRQGLPGYSTVQSQTERITKVYDLSHIGWRRHWAAAAGLRTGLGLYYLYQRDHFEDRRPKTVGVKPDEKNRTLSLGGNLRWSLPLSKWRQTLRGLVEFGQEAFRPEEIRTEVEQGERQTRRTLVLNLEDEINLITRRLRLVPTGRYERNTDHTQPFETIRRDMTTYNRDLIDTTVVHSQFSGTVGLVAVPRTGLSIKANYGRSYRVPSLMEIFGYRGMTVPNPGLKPERGLNRDVGINYDLQSGAGPYLTAEFAYFWSDVEDLIMFVYVPFARAAQAINIDSADIEGYECSISCGTWRGFTVSANLTHLTAINTGPVPYMNGKHLPNRPGDEASAAVRWSYRGASAFYEFDYISGNYWNAYNGVAPNNKGPLFATRSLHAAGAKVPTGIPRTDFGIEVRNMTNQQYEDVMGFPLPGRSTIATLMVRI